MRARPDLVGVLARSYTLAPGLRVLRARFSALSINDVTRALNNLVAPNENESKAVDMRRGATHL
jgi:DNA topoisomerase-3